MQRLQLCLLNRPFKDCFRKFNIWVCSDRGSTQFWSEPLLSTKGTAGFVIQVLASFVQAQDAS